MLEKMIKSSIYIINSTLFCCFVVSVVSLPSCGFCEVLMNDQSGARHSNIRASCAFLWKQERASHFVQHTAREHIGGKSTCMLKVFGGFPVYLSIKTDRYYYVLVHKFDWLELGTAKWYTTRTRLQFMSNIH